MDEWLQLLAVDEPIIEHRLKRVVNITRQDTFSRFDLKQRDIVSAANAAFHAQARNRLGAANYFDDAAKSEWILQYRLVSFDIEKVKDQLLNSVDIEYHLLNEARQVVWQKQVRAAGQQSKYSKGNYQALWLANLDKFMIELRASHDQEFALHRETLLGVADDSLAESRTLGSYLRQGSSVLASKTLVPVVVGTGKVIVGAAEVISDPAFAEALTQVAQEMQAEERREQELHRRTLLAMHEENLARESVASSSDGADVTAQTSAAQLSRNTSATIAEGQSKTAAAIAASDAGDADAIRQKEVEQREQQQRARLAQQEQEQQQKEMEKKRREEEQKALEAKKKKERFDYAEAVRRGTYVGAISCGANRVHLVGRQGVAPRPDGVYNACKLREVRYRCNHEPGWKTYTNNFWVLNNACIGAGDDVVVSVNCEASQVIVEKTAFTCDEFLQ